LRSYKEDFTRGVAAPLREQTPRIIISHAHFNLLNIATTQLSSRLRE
jgi:hypothetical protein